MYLKDGDYLGEYSNNAAVAPITPIDNFGLDDYEPEFFFDPLTWNTAKYSVALKYDDDDFTDDIFYFCHVSCFITATVTHMWQRRLLFLHRFRYASSHLYDDRVVLASPICSLFLFRCF